MLVLLAALAGAAVCVAIALAVITLPDGRQAPAPGGSAAASGAWPESQRKNFIDACVDSCRKAPGVTSARYPLCDQACKCAADEGERLVPGTELAAIYLAHQTGTASAEQKEKMQKLGDAGLACAMKFAK